MFNFQNFVDKNYLLMKICLHFTSQLVSSGAFEISFNDIPVWSKLETGRIPSPQEIFSIINQQMEMFSSKMQNFNE